MAAKAVSLAKSLKVNFTKGQNPWYIAATMFELYSVGNFLLVSDLYLGRGHQQAEYKIKALLLSWGCLCLWLNKRTKNNRKSDKI